MSRRLPDPSRDRRLCPENPLEAARQFATRKLTALSFQVPDLVYPDSRAIQRGHMGVQFHLQPASRSPKLSCLLQTAPFCRAGGGKRVMASWRGPLDGSTPIGSDNIITLLPRRGPGHVSAGCSPLPPGRAIALSVRLRLISLQNGAPIYRVHSADWQDLDKGDGMVRLTKIAACVIAAAGL